MVIDIKEEFIDATTMITQHLPKEQWHLEGSSSYCFDETAEEERGGTRFPRKAARHYFSGFVLRGDGRAPRIIYKQGFTLYNSLSDGCDIHQRIAKAMGVSRKMANTGAEGISTTCLYKFAKIFKPEAGFIYLIDARGLWGVIIEFSDQREDPPYVEVNYVHNIPAKCVLGVLDAGLKNRLYINPDYSGLDSIGRGDFRVVERYLRGSMPCQLSYQQALEKERATQANLAWAEDAGWEVLN